MKPSGVERPTRRRWHFADCSFDEASWCLVVGGNRVTVEAKPLELLMVLLEAAGNFVSKDELLDRIWPNVTVVEGSLPTAVHKLRQALNDEGGSAHIIETISRIGYRLAVPVRVENSGAAPLQFPVADRGSEAAAVATLPAWSSGKAPVRVLSVLTALAVAATVGAFMFGPPNNLHATKARPAYTQRQVKDALRRLDIREVERMLAAGWDPNLPFGDDGNAAINYVLDRCEWDHGHHQEEILLMIRTLTEAHAVVDRRNIWGDTPYSIAKANRFCGPKHPVTRYFYMMCAQGEKPLGDKCMASYELKRGRHFTMDPTRVVASR